MVNVSIFSVNEKISANILQLGVFLSSNPSPKNLNSYLNPVTLYVESSYKENILQILQIIMGLL